MDSMLEKQRKHETKASCPYFLEYLPLILCGNLSSFRHSLNYCIALFLQARTCDIFDAHA